MGDENRTNVIVVGAGASKEFGLPTAEGLAEQISRFCRMKMDSIGNIVEGNATLRPIIRSLAARSVIANQLENYFDATNQIADNMPLAPSIDNFMDTRRDDPLVVEVGKYAIAACILDAERNSIIALNESNIFSFPNFQRSKATWIQRLFKILVSQRGFEQFLAAMENITFVSFNYDRCIQHFFVFAAKSYFNLDGPATERVAEALHIIHPYGSLGELEIKDGRPIGFGAEFNEGNLHFFANRIQTFTEVAISQSVKPSIIHALEGCDVLMFLGFAFHPLNMELLIPKKTQIQVSRVLATGKGASKESQEMIRHDLSVAFSPRNERAVSIVDGTCDDLFFQHHRYLSEAQSKHS